MEKVLVIIVTYNATHWLKSCLESIDMDKYDVIVIDNNSSDGTAGIIEKEYPKVNLIQSEENLGFGKANNIGLTKALDNGSDYILLLNQDAWLESDTIDRLIKEQQENPQFWVLSPLQCQSIYNTVEPQFNKYLIKNKIDLGKNSVQEVDFVNAAIWLMTRYCVETVGGFDGELFPHYGEDTDYLQRVNYWGGKIGILPTVIAYHDRIIPIEINYEKTIYVTTLAYLGYLKDINNLLIVNLQKCLIIFIRKSIKMVLTLDFFPYKINYIALRNSLSKLNIIIKHRKRSLIKKAFLN